MDTPTTEAKPKSDDDILATFEAESRARTDAAVAAAKSSQVEAIKKLEELRAANQAEELMIIGDSSGGSFRGVFRPASMDTWKTFKTELRSEQQRPLANRNLAVRCLVWPGHQDLERAAARRPALYDVIAGTLAAEAGSGQEGILKK